MEISRRLFILLVSTVIGFMFALVAAVAVLVVRGPAGEMASAHAASQGIGAVADERTDPGQNRLAALDVGEEEEQPIDEQVAAAAVKQEEDRLGKQGLESLSPETIALLVEGDEGGVDEEGGEKKAAATPQPAPAPGRAVAAEQQPPQEAEAVVAKGQGANPVPQPAKVADAPESAGAGPTGQVLTPKPGDADGDGVPDRDDQCVTVAEDKDGFLDGDGCPDLDNDEDGIPDKQDRCPLEKETRNGNEDEDGCPDEVKPTAIATPKVAALPGVNGKTWKIYFGHMKWALSRSEKRRIRRAIRGIGKGHNRSAIYIQGHADGSGNVRVNRWYANKRAKSVRKYLIAKGVAGTRIQMLDAVVGGPSGADNGGTERRVDIFLAE